MRMRCKALRAVGGLSGGCVDSGSEFNVAECDHEYALKLEDLGHIELLSLDDEPTAAGESSGSQQSEGTAEDTSKPAAGDAAPKRRGRPPKAKDSVPPAPEPEVNSDGNGSDTGKPEESVPGV